MLHREVEGDGHQNQQMSVNSTTGQGKGRYQESSSHRFENGNKSHGNQDDDLRMVVCGDEDDEELQLEPDFPSAHMDTNGPDARDSQRDVQDSWALTKKLETLTAEHNATREMLAKTKSDLLDTIKTLEVTKKSEADLRSHLVLLKKQIEKMRVDAKDHDFVTEVCLVFFT